MIGCDKCWLRTRTPSPSSGLGYLTVGNSGSGSFCSSTAYGGRRSKALNADWTNVWPTPCTDVCTIFTSDFLFISLQKKSKHDLWISTVFTSKHHVLVRPTWQLMHLKHYTVESLACFKWYMLLSKLCIYAAPVMAVFLDGFEVFCVNILIVVFEQSALQSLLRVPRLRPRLQVFHNGFRYTFVMRSHNLGTILPVHLGQNQKKLNVSEIYGKEIGTL